jgi:branched-subunit amino acid aminotransferase/4-amino-4-deoxychorismate lyase
MLEGITRKLILEEILPQLNIPVRLEAICVADIPHLDEAALSGSSRAFLPVV